MEVTLKVLAGAKKGAKVVVKKSEFTIGRSEECHLSVGSTSISRRHCTISRGENKVSVKDLGSRNGTLVNGKKIDGEVELVAGDELVVGPLKFQVRISTGLKNDKKPKVKSVAEAVERTADSGSGEFDVDDISSWLLGPEKPAASTHETVQMQMDETSSMPITSGPKPAEAKPPEEAQAPEGSSVIDEEPAKPESGSGSGKKKAPGKLPPVPKKDNTKDSREAAENALRAWSRRR
ncbi:FHA domain-containing protein [Adhaeretor mobilis]|uniref:Glycogen accumulation regulator GarA n=1 Tax=Adhaeretor mobilis TaxID=1930276 RepID=A0A517N2J3_9BACT|nr:FHA domain-containing protein [Adhaeretor mobilis]QDT01218.1 Glycogen accumulation regulator GarA [Adhaeretor mobilis]